MDQDNEPRVRVFFQSHQVFPPRRVTSQLMRRGERASWRGRGTNTSASSSNITTPATTSTTRTRTDRYRRARRASHLLCFCSLFFPQTADSFPGGEGRNKRWTSLGVTNAFPQHKSRTPAFLCLPISICICVSTGFHTQNRITQSNSVLLSPLSCHLLPLRLSVCLCLSVWDKEKRVEICLLLR